MNARWSKKDDPRMRRQLYEKAQRAKQQERRDRRGDIPPSPVYANLNVQRSQQDNDRSEPLLPVDNRFDSENDRENSILDVKDNDYLSVDNDDQADDNGVLEYGSTTPVTTPKLHLSNTQGSLSSIMTNESSDVDQSAVAEDSSVNSLFKLQTVLDSPTRIRSQHASALSPPVSPGSYGSHSFVSHLDDVRVPSPKHREKLNKWYQKRSPVLSKSSSRSQTLDTNTLEDIDDSGLDAYTSYNSDDEELTAASPDTYYRSTKRGEGVMDIEDGDYLRTKQSVAYFSIGLTAIQLFILMLQLTTCGIAPVEMNPLIGPYPDAFSEFGGKNTYLMITMNQWWRLVTPSFLHVGILHLLANAFCQLEAIALFEREWGSFRWLLVYLISSVGCSGMSSIFDPATIAVGSSGALMGLYAAKLAQVTIGICFDVSKKHMNNAIRLDQLSSVLCGLTLVSMLSCFTFIDWSGHFGGLVSGFLSGCLLFSYPIRRCCSWFFWCLCGLAGLVGTLTGVFYYLMLTYEPFEELGEVCEYFQSIFPETYECGCMNL